MRRPHGRLLQLGWFSAVETRVERPASEKAVRWALKEGAVLEDGQVADVRVLERFSFVEVDGDVAERTVEFLDGSRLKGSAIRVEIARS